MTEPVTAAKVQAALRAEARKLDARHRGVHIFNPIWPAEDQAANWSTTFLCRGSDIDLDVMRDALRRVQARFPVVRW